MRLMSVPITLRIRPGHGQSHRVDLRNSLSLVLRGNLTYSPCKFLLGVQRETLTGHVQGRRDERLQRNAYQAASVGVRTVVDAKVGIWTYYHIRTSCSEFGGSHY